MKYGQLDKLTFPVMAGFQVSEDHDINYFDEHEEWVSHEDTSLDFRGPA
jgi:hypothetical protein